MSPILAVALFGQGTIIAWDRTCWRVSSTFYPMCETVFRVCQELARRWEEWERGGGTGQIGCVCAHTRPPRSRLLTELTCLELVCSACGFAGPRHDNTLFSKPKVPIRERPWALCKLPGLPGVSITHTARGRYYLPVIEFARTVANLQLSSRHLLNNI